MVMVWWLDSKGGGNWTHFDDFDDRVAEIISVGILISEDSKKISMTSSLDQDSECFFSPFTIPVRCITKKVYLER